MTPFRNEKNSNWEGAYRVPCMVRWPGHIKAGSICNEIVAHLDWAPTILAAAGVPDVKEQLLKGMKVGDANFKVHLDGYNLLPLLTGQTKDSPRKEFYYFNDDSELVGLRYDNCSSICGPIRSNGRTSRRTRTTTGGSTTPSSASRHSTSSASFSRRSRSSRPARRPAASA
jgi:arylsulfatase